MNCITRSVEHNWSLILILLNEKTGPPNSILNRNSWAPAKSADLRQTGKEAEELHGGPPILVLYSDSTGTHAGLQETLTLGHWTSAPGTVITKWNKHHTHACKNTSKEVKMEVHFLWMEGKSSFQPGAMPEAALFVFARFFRNTTAMVSESFPQSSTADSHPAQCVAPAASKRKYSSAGMWLRASCFMLWGQGIKNKRQVGHGGACL